jgi:hypothetical protein
MRSKGLNTGSSGAVLVKSIKNSHRGLWVMDTTWPNPGGGVLRDLAERIPVDVHRSFLRGSNIAVTFPHRGKVGTSDEDVEKWEKVDAVSKPVCKLVHL